MSAPYSIDGPHYTFTGTNRFWPNDPTQLPDSTHTHDALIQAYFDHRRNLTPHLYNEPVGSPLPEKARARYRRLMWRNHYPAITP